jgi:hypothetical protein
MVLHIYAPRNFADVKLEMLLACSKPQKPIICILYRVPIFDVAAENPFVLVVFDLIHT